MDKNKKNKQESAAGRESRQKEETQKTSDSSAALATVNQEKKKAESKDDMFPIVGIGASAGGIEALETFFGNMPADAGIGFIVVQHLHPDHESHMPEVLQKNTEMQVTEATNDERVEANHVYIIPPGKSITLENRSIKLIDPETPSGKRIPIDTLFRSMAQELQQRAICIILSGTGSDGTNGMREIKAVGGMAMVQDEKSAGHKGMPRSAIDTELPDYILPPEELAQGLVEYCTNRDKLGWGEVRIKPEGINERKLDKLFSLMKLRNGHDFSRYKKNTVLRRVQRRMSINKSQNFDEYLELIQEDKQELDSLFNDLLIGVTAFFRDRKAWEELEHEVILKLVADNDKNREDDEIRVWVNGCATGEEAYSLAILFKEAEKKLGVSARVKIFATDISDRFIEIARRGVFSESAVSDVPGRYLDEYFEKTEEGYKTEKPVRKMLNFARQDITSDPPFSRLDLISCRNLLIYMEKDLQEKIFGVFHYSLKEDGYLFIGSAETVSTEGGRFAAVDERSYIYKKQGSTSNYRSSSHHHFTLDYTRPRKQKPVSEGDGKEELSYQKLIEKILLKKYVPAAVLIDNHHQILHIHGRTGKYLEPAAGEARLDILKMAREGLELELKTAIYHAVGDGGLVRKDGVKVKTNGGFERVNLMIVPLSQQDLPEGLKLVVFEEAREPEAGRKAVFEAGSESEQVEALQAELKATKEDLQTTIEELETSNEELTSTNEELQSTNEELQSTNQELETSKEELQSINEELTTVNSELEDKVSDLEAIQNDLHNLLASTNIGTIFLDTNLKILRFTAHATDFIPIIKSDVGRSIEELSRVRAYEDIVDDCHRVLNDLTTVERELKTDGGEWFSVRIRPYRTTRNAIVGVVIAFINISELKTYQEELLKNQERFNLALKQSPVTIFNQDTELKYTWIHNPRVDYLSGDVVGKFDADIFSEQVANKMKTIKQGVLQSGVGTQQSIQFTSGEEELEFSLTVEPLRNSEDEVIGITCALVEEVENKKK